MVWDKCCKSTVMCLMITKWEQLGWTKGNERGYWCACMVAAACRERARETRAVNSQNPIAANNGIIFNRSPQITALLGLCGLQIRVYITLNHV